MQTNVRTFLPDTSRIQEELRKLRDEHLDKVTGSLLEVFQAPLAGISYALEAKDEYSFSHSERVAQLAISFVRYLDLPTMDRHLLAITAQVHDIGKIGIRDAVLLKPDRLTDEEYAAMQKHSDIGADIIHKASHPDEERMPFAVPDLFRQSVIKIEEGTRHHHERWDGRGYPGHLQGKDIPVFSRIIALCDSTDAMLSTRVYRKALTMEHCRREIERNAGVMYDPDMAAVYLAHWDDIVTPVFPDAAHDGPEA